MGWLIGVQYLEASPFLCSISHLHSYRLLAFIAALKKRHRNSCVHYHEEILTVCKDLKISEGTYRKYRNECFNLGLLKGNKRKYTVVKLKYCILTLIDNTKDFRFVQFFKGVPKGLSVNEIYKKIVYDIAKVNFSKQQHKINIKKRLTFFFKHCYTGKKELAYLKRIARKQGVSLGQLKKSSLKLNGSIVTGKYHLSNIIGCSSSTASRVLNLWAKMGNIKKEYGVKYTKMDVTHSAFDYLKGKGLFVIPSRDQSGWLRIQGTKITSFL